MNPRIYILRAAATATLALVLALPAFAETIMIHAGRVLDMPGSPPRDATTIVIIDGRIVSLEDGYAPAADGISRVIDLKDAFVLPCRGRLY